MSVWGVRVASGSVFFYDRALREGEDPIRVARYMVGNPLRAGLVSSVEEYLHWDARWL